MSRRAWWAVSAAAVAVQLAVLYVPRAPQVPTGLLPVDKAVHVVVFALPVVALVAAGLPRWGVVGVMAGHAVLSEALQATFLNQRSGDPADVVADLVGVVIGALLTRPGGRLAAPDRARPGPS